MVIATMWRLEDGSRVLKTEVHAVLPPPWRLLLRDRLARVGLLPMDELVREEFSAYLIALSGADRLFWREARKHKWTGLLAKALKRISRARARDEAMPAYAHAAEVLKALLNERPYYAKFLDRHRPGELDPLFDYRLESIPRLLPIKLSREVFDGYAVPHVCDVMAKCAEAYKAGRTEPWQGDGPDAPYRPQRRW